MATAVDGAGPEAFRINLARARDRLNLTQERLAELVGMSREAVAAWESGRAYPKFELLFKLGKALNVPLKELLDGYEERPGPTSEEQIAETVIERLMKLLGVSLEGLDPGHDDGEATPDGAPMESKDQVLLDRFAEVLAQKLAAQLTQILVPALQQTVEETLKQMPNAQKR